MLILVTGASASGKSEFAENLTAELGSDLTYIATMKPSDAESGARIARHRKMRAKKGFKTVERYTDIKNLEIRGTALLECMSNLLANEMFGGTGANAAEEITKGIESLIKQLDNLVIVTNEIFSDGVEYDRDTKIYMKRLGTLNCKIAKAAGAVYEVMSGVPVKIK